MEQFLVMFGDVSVTIAQIVGLGVLAFSVYRAGEKGMEYFTEKKKTIVAKAQAERDKDEEWQRIAEQVRSIGALNAKIDQIGEALSKMQRETEEARATTCRYRILRFDDELRHKVHHSKEHFDQILDDIKTYEDYCDEHPKYENNKAVMAIKNIEKIYEKCGDEDLFL